MSLRVSSNMLNDQLVRNLNRNSLQLNRLQTQMSTGRKINKPSDDPVGITYALRYRSELSANLQYQSNVSSSLSWLEYTDNMMDQAGEVVQRTRELVVKAATGSNPQSALDSILCEIEELSGQMVDIANSRLNGKYIFNGQQYEKKPYDLERPNVFPGMTIDPTNAENNLEKIKTDAERIEFPVSEGVRISLNITGNELFGGLDALGNVEQDHVFGVFSQIKTALQSGDFSKLTGIIEQIDLRMDKLLNVRAEVGARVNRVELLEGRLKDLEENLTQLQSKTEDANYSQLIMESKISENVYHASLAVGSKIIMPSLVDFLR